jgi:hypothetical protein
MLLISYSVTVSLEFFINVDFKHFLQKMANTKLNEMGMLEFWLLILYIQQKQEWITWI